MIIKYDEKYYNCLFISIYIYTSYKRILTDVKNNVFKLCMISISIYDYSFVRVFFKSEYTFSNVFFV